MRHARDVMPTLQPLEGRAAPSSFSFSKVIHQVFPFFTKDTAATKSSAKSTNAFEKFESRIKSFVSHPKHAAAVAHLSADREARLLAAENRIAVHQAAAHPVANPHFRTFNWYKA